jgi:molybdopterin-guanine dinucleotide biosynthesis protein B
MPVSHTSPAILLIVGFSGSGKTRLMTQLIEALSSRCLRVGAVKHHGHHGENGGGNDIEMDRPGKDTWKYREAGAKATVISSRSGIGMVRDVNHDHDPGELARLMADMDIVLAEGYKRSAYPKIEVFRKETGKPPACRDDDSLIAVVCDTPLDWGTPQFGTDAIGPLADFILKKLKLVV